MLMRKYIRHPTGMPLKFSLQGDLPPRRERLKDVSNGGLCFGTAVAMEPGYIVRLLISIADQYFEADAHVVWCREDGGGFDIGVRFDSEEDEFALRMVEQLCYIEQYRRQVAEDEGRHLSSEEAAHEWIERFAADFPTLQ